MRKPALLIVLSLALSLATLVTVAGATTMPLFPDQTDPVFGVSVDVRPAGNSPIQPLRRGAREVPYLCSAVVTRAGNAEARIGPMTVYPGQLETRSTTTGGLTVKLVANISADGSKAETRVTVRRGDHLLTNQSASVWLQPGEPANPIQPLQ
jgi:hypothetical protein